MAWINYLLTLPWVAISPWNLKQKGNFSPGVTHWGPGQKAHLLTPLPHLPEMKNIQSSPESLTVLILHGHQLQLPLWLLGQLQSNILTRGSEKLHNRIWCHYWEVLSLLFYFHHMPWLQTSKTDNVRIKRQGSLPTILLQTSLCCSQGSWQLHFQQAPQNSNEKNTFV